MRIKALINSPIRKNLAANLYGTGIQLFNQIILVPFYIVFWGNELYSDWIVISALTAFFTMSDIGLNNVIQNRFAMKLAEGNTRECDALMTDNYILVTIIFVVVLCLSAVYLLCWDITSVMNIHILNRTEASVIFILLIWRVFVDMYRNVENAIYRAVHKASRAILFDQSTTLIIALVTLGCIIAGVSMVRMCLFIITPSIIMMIYKYYDVKRYYNYHFSFKQFNTHLLKEVFIPALSFMSFPAGNAIVLQGYTLIVNAYFGPATVVLYNTTRTLCNFSKSLLGTLQNSVWPEYSIAYGKQDFSSMRRLHRKIMRATILAALTIGCGLFFAGPYIYEIWTHNKVEFNVPLMAVYIVVLFVESLWTSSSVTLMATNNHLKLGMYYLCSTSMALVAAIILCRMGLSLPYITASLILSNAIMCFYTIPAGFRLTKDTILNNEIS